VSSCDCSLLTVHWLSVTLLYLIRHARSTWNAQGRWQGQADPPLDDIGLMQAQALAQHLRAEPLLAVYSSPLQRARQTAEAIAAEHGLNAILDDRLKERNVGQWSGLTEAEVRERFPDYFKPGWWQHGPPGGENQIELNTRTLAVFGEILAAHPEGSVAVVSHGGTLNAYLLTTLGVPLGQHVSFRFANASYARVYMHEGRIHVASLCEVGHLNGLGH
jgi:broad specificity phosphatase PhoE